MKFGENLRNLRKYKKISQEELAEELGVSRQSVSKWECGDAYPEMNNILALCDIFHCKINDLVQESMIDSNKLSEDVKNKAVKFSEEKQKKVKGLSKIIYVFARICKIINIVGIITVILMMIGTIYASSKIEVSNNTITLWDTKITLNESNKVLIKYQDKEKYLTKYSEINAIEKIMNKLEQNEKVELTIFIEIAWLTLLITLIFSYFIFLSLEKLFINIYTGETPFTLENIAYIKKIAFYLIIIIALPNIIGLITEKIIKLDLGIGFELFDIIYILGLFTLAYVFEYGYVVERDFKGLSCGER